MSAIGIDTEGVGGRRVDLGKKNRPVLLNGQPSLYAVPLGIAFTDRYFTASDVCIPLNLAGKKYRCGAQ